MQNIEKQKKNNTFLFGFLCAECEDSHQHQEQVYTQDEIQQPQSGKQHQQQQQQHLGFADSFTELPGRKNRYVQKGKKKTL